MSMGIPICVIGTVLWGYWLYHAKMLVDELKRRREPPPGPSLGIIVLWGATFQRLSERSGYNLSTNQCAMKAPL